MPLESRLWQGDSHGIEKGISDFLHPHYVAEILIYIANDSTT
jgi:hypothetical protein